MSTTPQSLEGEVLDMRALDQLRALQRPGKPNILERVISMFVVDAPRLIGQMEDARSSLDWNSLHVASHTLRSSAANLGAIGISALCAQIEAHVKQGEYERASGLVLEVRDQFPTVKNALQAITGVKGE